MEEVEKWGGGESEEGGGASSSTIPLIDCPDCGGAGRDAKDGTICVPCRNTGKIADPKVMAATVQERYARWVRSTGGRPPTPAVSEASGDG